MQPLEENVASANTGHKTVEFGICFCQYAVPINRTLEKWDGSQGQIEEMALCQFLGFSAIETSDAILSHDHRKKKKGRLPRLASKATAVLAS